MDHSVQANAQRPRQVAYPRALVRIDLAPLHLRSTRTNTEGDSALVRAIGYGRVSTEEQARDGYSLAGQEQSVRAYCLALGWELVAFHTDAGRSGKSITGRDALARLLEDVRRDGVEKVIVWRLDR